MARINIEDRSRPAIAKLADFVGCSRREALGTVGSLWGESQELLRTSGSREEIADWADIFMLEKDLVDNWISGMIRAGFLKLTQDGYEIRGNETQIETRISNMTRAGKGGEATKKKWAEIKMAKASGESEGLKPTASTASSTLGLGPTKAMQGNARQCIEETPNGVSSSAVVAAPPPRQPTEATKFFIPSEPSDLFLSVSPKTIERWAKLYPDRDFVSREVVKALNYYANNPKKQPRTIRGWVSAMSSWFERGWRTHQASIKGNGGANRGIAEILKDKTATDSGPFKLVPGGGE